MFYSDKIKNIANIYRNSFATIFQGYKDKCLENTNVLSDWKKKSATAEQYLNDEINSINHKFFRKKVHQLISLKKPNISTMQCDFDKMCYYIDMLNKELYSSTIMKYNPSYCYEIVDTIASEYVSILSVLKNSAFFMEQANKTAFKYAKEDMMNTWKKMMEKEIDTVVKMEYDKLISEIENSVSNYSSTTETNYE